MSAVHIDGKYEIHQHPMEQYSDEFRVVDKETGNESFYYKLIDCLQIIEHAKAGTLLGSFDL